jgi:hypothetical protein
MSQAIVHAWQPPPKEGRIMSEHDSEGPTYELTSHSPVLDDPDWSICTFQDPASPGTGGITVTVSAGVLERLIGGDLAGPLSEAAVTALDGH